MLVVADSSPLIVLISIGHVGVLPELFGRVVIPPEVAEEVSKDDRPQLVREFMAAVPRWLAVRAPATNPAIPMLHAGEVAAINLAKELGADLLLIDEREGRTAAAKRGIPLTGTIGVLELAANRKLIDLADAFERVKRTDFWISHKLLDERLRRFRESNPG